MMPQTTTILMMDANGQVTPDDPPRPRRDEAATRAPMCYFCSSTDSMEPFTRTDQVFLLSVLFPRLRVRYCRYCTRHFLFIAPRRARTPASPDPLPPPAAHDG